ncbi:hypothetical protein Tsubulata_028403 [Turnera subulata]|uniref:DCD domain-containing protein n=1 Tax=Turnera subulata TaxID=218843 RepID=A0A9Q0J7A1_9ROSI|nr:hypothetical protein Tsubulata_028403 [Turnera subulata]
MINDTPYSFFSMVALKCAGAHNNTYSSVCFFPLSLTHTRTTLFPVSAHFALRETSALLFPFSAKSSHCFTSLSPHQLYSHDSLSREDISTHNQFMSLNLEADNMRFRNLQKSQLGGVIFGCTNATIKECLFKQLFGLPGHHISYVKNIEPGLPLFLFNYNTRKLHGIYEAASSGQMNLNPYGWTTDGANRTQFPAQVQIRVRLQCQTLLEEQFKPMIQDNYFSHGRFWFELDHAQTSKLVSLFSSVVETSAPSISVPQNVEKWRAMFQAHSLPEPAEEIEGFKQFVPGSDLLSNSNAEGDSIFVASLTGDDQLLDNQQHAKVADLKDKDLIVEKLKELARNHEPRELPLKDCTEDAHAKSDIISEEKGYAEEQRDLQVKNDMSSPFTSSDCQSIIAQLVQEMEELKAFKTEQTLKMACMEQKLVEAEKQILQLKVHCLSLESTSMPQIGDSEYDNLDELQLDPTEAIHLLGGYDGETWLPVLELYFPSKDVIKPLSPMSSARSYASVACLHGELYVFGGGNGTLWFDTVESYNHANDQWSFRPSLTRKKGSLGGATLNDKIFAVGGGNGTECFSDVEMLDLDIGRWIPTRSMLHKRFALAAVELNGVLYATGGFDGKDYLRSAERFDPREHSWRRIASMNTKRGCHSLVVFNDKLYALGGFDANTMVPSTEIYDPRLDLWITGDPMNDSRGYSAAAVVQDSIYVVGGLKSDKNIVETVEYFKEGQGWQEKTSGPIRKRCFLSAAAL